MKNPILKLGVLFSCIAIMACGVACGESASGGMLQGGNRVEISDDGYLVIDGIKTNFGAENGKSAYEIYCEENPDYKGNEAQWMNDLTSGKLATQKEYSLISYGRNREPIIRVEDCL